MADYPLFDPINDPIWTNTPDIVNFSRNVLIPASPHFDFFLYCLQRPLSFASIMLLPFPDLYIGNEPIELIETIYTGENVLYCVILRFENTLFIICKGTTQRSEMIIDSNLELVPHPTIPGKVKVHAGFLYLYKMIQDKVKQTLEKFPDSDLVFSGTSLGACISHLLFIETALNNPKGTRSRTVTNTVFAPPKCGDRSFYNFFHNLIESQASDGLLLRGYVNSVDVIPHMPPFGYGKLPNKWLTVFKIALGDVYKNHIVAYADYFTSIGVEIDSIPNGNIQIISAQVSNRSQREP